jgi:hypothetical protein
LDLTFRSGGLRQKEIKKVSPFQKVKPLKHWALEIRHFTFSSSCLLNADRSVGRCQVYTDETCQRAKHLAASKKTGNNREFLF